MLVIYEQDKEQYNRELYEWLERHNEQQVKSPNKSDKRSVRNSSKLLNEEYEESGNKSVNNRSQTPRKEEQEDSEI